MGKQPAKPRPTERAHRANTRNAAQHRLPRGLTCALCNVISVEVSTINPVCGLRKGRLAGSRPLLPGSRHSRSTGPPRSAVPTPGQAQPSPRPAGHARARATRSRGPGRCGYRGPDAYSNTDQPAPGCHRQPKARPPLAYQWDFVSGCALSSPSFTSGPTGPGGHPQGCPSSSRGISMTALRRPSTPASTQPERRPRQVRLGQVSRARDQHR